MGRTMTVGAGSTDMVAPDQRPIDEGRAILAAFAATLVGIGLARFAYTPLIPAVIKDGWFSPSDAYYLGAANLAGYLIGALGAARLRGEPAAWLRGMMLVATLSFAACAVPFGPPDLYLAWFFAWRLAAGIAGGGLMVLATSTVLPRIAADRRGRAGGLVFTGVGLGIAASGTLVPLLLLFGLTTTWLGLGLLAAVMTLVTWTAWPPAEARSAPADRPAVKPLGRMGPGLAAVCLGYGLNAAGLVPHMIFLVDHAARGLGLGVGAGAVFWVLFGLGAAGGGVLAGRIADRIGFRRALLLIWLCQAVVVGMVAAVPGTAAPGGLPLGLVVLGVSAVIAGACVPGIVPLAAGRVRELAARDRISVAAAWSAATAAFALGQALAAYGLTALYEATGSHQPLYAVATLCLVAALLAGALVDRPVDPREEPAA